MKVIETIGVRNIWGSYEGRKGTINGKTGESKCAEAKMALLWLGGEWMNLAAAVGSGGEYY